MVIFRQLWFLVLVAMAAGIALGRLDPAIGTQMNPLGDGFVALMRMMIAPVIFCTVVHGVAGMNNASRVGRVAGKALLYFLAITLPALVFALIAVLLITSKGAAGVPGAAFIVLAATLGAVGTIPVASIALVLGIHRLMAEALTFVNLIGNAPAAVVVCRWERALDVGRLAETIGLRRPQPAETRAAA